MTEILDILNPILPSTFDKNEIFTLLISILVTCLTFYLHKRNRSLLTTEFIAIALLNLLFSIIGESIMAEPPLDFYDTADKPFGELSDICLQIFVYPPTLLIVMQCFAKYKPNKWLYIFVIATVLTMFEYISVEFFNLFQYKKWNLGYSFFFYVLIIFLNILFYNKIHSALINIIRQNEMK